MSILDKFFESYHEKYLKKIQPLVNEINNFEPKFKSFSDKQLKEKTKEFKQVIRDNKKTLDDILPEAFALVREVSKRTLKQRHYDVQLIGGIVLHQGKIAEMKTGEGKTLAATLPVYLNALSGKGVHVVTVNDYLSRRDAVWMGQIYHFLGLSVSCLNHQQSFLYDPEYKEVDEAKDKIRDELGGFKVVEDYLRPCERNEVYQADITYGTNNEFGFDYLRDNMVFDKRQQTQRGFNYAIIDEIDSILIDEARTPLIISAPDVESSDMYKQFSRIIPNLQKEKDFELDEKLKAVTLTEDGIEHIERLLGMKDIYQEKGIKYLHHLEQALRAQILFEKDKNYVVKDGQIIIVDEFTGRLLPGRRYSGGLHQAIEAKEKVEVQPESVTLSSITFQNYFRFYKKLAGMTGTAFTSDEEFNAVYGLEVIVIPTNKPMIRKELPDKIYKTEIGKLKAVIREIKERYNKKQPVLVGTVSIEKNEYLGKLLEREGIPHKILNAKNHEKEAEIISQAGKLGSVTVATNMAGRGVDIILGGNPCNQEESEQVKKTGGLFVIGTERHDARRIDNQLRGRTGRQGDPGASQFFISLDDNLLRIFGGDKIKSLMEKLNFPEDEPIENKFISNSVESAQSKIEGMNFDARKHLLEYDDVLSKHREVIYQKRKEILEKNENDLRIYILEIIKKQSLSEKDYEKKEKEIGIEDMRKFERIVALKTLDFLWMNHLDSMGHLRDSVKLRAYGQKDPLVEYKGEGHKMFKDFMKNFEASVANNLFKVKRTLPQNTSVISRNVSEKKVGRNEPCPCGSGKKYKKCCGK